MAFQLSSDWGNVALGLCVHVNAKHYVKFFTLSTEIGNKRVEFLTVVLKHHALKHHVSNMACNKCGKSLKGSIRACERFLKIP